MTEIRTFGDPSDPALREDGDPPFDRPDSRDDWLGEEGSVIFNGSTSLVLGFLETDQGLKQSLDQAAETGRPRVPEGSIANVAHQLLGFVDDYLTSYIRNSVERVNPGVQVGTEVKDRIRLNLSIDSAGHVGDPVNSLTGEGLITTFNVSSKLSIIALLASGREDNISAEEVIGIIDSARIRSMCIEASKAGEAFWNIFSNELSVMPEFDPEDEDFALDTTKEHFLDPFQSIYSASHTEGTSAGKPEIEDIVDCTPERGLSFSDLALGLMKKYRIAYNSKAEGPNRRTGDCPVTMSHLSIGTQTGLANDIKTGHFGDLVVDRFNNRAASSVGLDEDDEVSISFNPVIPRTINYYAELLRSQFL